MTHLEHPPSHFGNGTLTVGRMRRFSYMERMFAKASNLEGDVVECGVGRGDTFSMLAYLIGREGKDRTLRGFDSFEGFPEPSSEDASWRNPQKGEWDFEEHVVHELLRMSGVTSYFPDLNIKVVKGFFNKTLPLESSYDIAFLHADGDLYESYRDVLTYMWDRVVSGGVVLFDEYKELKKNPKTGDVEDKWPGATKAIDNFLSPLGLVPICDEETGKYHIIKP